MSYRRLTLPQQVTAWVGAFAAVEVLASVIFVLVVSPLYLGFSRLSLGFIIWALPELTVKLLFYEAVITPWRDPWVAPLAVASYLTAIGLVYLTWRRLR